MNQPPLLHLRGNVSTSCVTPSPTWPALDGLDSRKNLALQQEMWAGMPTLLEIGREQTWPHLFKQALLIFGPPSVRTALSRSAASLKVCLEGGAITTGRTIVIYDQSSFIGKSPLCSLGLQLCCIEETQESTSGKFRGVQKHSKTLLNDQADPIGSLRLA